MSEANLCILCRVRICHYVVSRDLTDKVCACSDTGYRGRLEGPVCPVFNEIGERFRQIDFAAIPIWRGGTLSFIAKIGLRVG